MSSLPDPAWVTHDARCLGCGYSLAGIELPGKCPECGAAISAWQLVIFGVPRARDVMSTWRVVSIVALIITAMFGPQLLIAIGYFGSWWLSLSVLLAGVMLVIGLIVTSPRSQGGTSRIVVVPGRLCVRAGSKPATDESGGGGASIELTPGSKVELQRVGDVWCKLRIRNPAGAVVFEAGIRCPAQHRHLVKEVIDNAIRGDPNLAALPHGLSPRLWQT